MVRNMSITSWDKIKEFIKALLASVVIGVLFLGYNDLYLGMQLTFLILFSYYLLPTIIGTFLKDFDIDQSSFGDRFGRIIAIFLMLGLMSSLSASLLWAVSGADYCKGWAKSEYQCAKKQLSENYYTESYF